MLRKFQYISYCRLCSSSALRSVINFGELPLGNDLNILKTNALNSVVYPLVLNCCNDCGHFQLSVSVDPKILYATNYTYLSGTSQIFVDHFGKYAETMVRRYSLAPGSLVIDVGSNDGTCLRAFKSWGMKVVGVDAAEIPVRKANGQGIDTELAFFNLDFANHMLQKYGKADFITSHNVMAHIEDILSVLRGVYVLLNDRGGFVFEVGYFHSVVANNVFDTVYHEHLDYHTAGPMANFLCRMGFDVVAFEINEIQGGTIRVFARKSSLGQAYIEPIAQQFIRMESDSHLLQPLSIEDKYNGFKACLAELAEAVSSHRARGFKIVGYGAPTKLVMLLKLSGISTDDIDCVYEDNKEKVGRYVPNSAIPIYPEDHLTFDGDLMIVIFAWNFADDIAIKIRNKKYTQGCNDSSATVVCAPLPRLKYYAT